MYKNAPQRKNDVNDDYFDEMNNTKYWVLGLFSSDGYISKKTSNSQVSISQSGKNGRNIIDFIKKEICFKGNIVEQTSKISSAKYYSLIFSSFKLKSIIKEYKIYNEVDSIYFIPPIDENYLKPFIAGYLEGDGSIRTYNYKNSSQNYLMISICGNEKFIKFLKEKLPYYTNTRQLSNSHLWEIRWYGTKAIAFGEWLYDFDMDYISPKKQSFLYFKKLYYSSSRYKRKQEYKKIKEKLLEYLENTINPDIMVFSKKYNVSYSAVYHWIKKWKSQGIVQFETIYEKSKEKQQEALSFFKNNPTANKNDYCKKHHISKKTLHRILREGIKE